MGSDAQNEKKKLARRMLKKKIKTVEEEITRSIAQTRFTKRKEARKKQFKTNIIIGASCIALAGLIYFVFFKVGKGPTQWGLCKVFVELQVEYPATLRYTRGQIYKDKIRVEYAHHDSFGQNQLETIDCFFKRAKNRQLYLHNAQRNRRQVDPRIVKGFNQTIPALLDYPLDYTFPKGLPNELKAYKR